MLATDTDREGLKLHLGELRHRLAYVRATGTKANATIHAERVDGLTTKERKRLR